MDNVWNKFYPSYLTEQTGSAANSGDTLYGRLARAAHEYPGRVAYEYWKLKVTYAGLIDQIDYAAHAWSSVGVREGDTVCLCMGGCPNILISIYALDKIGASVAFCIPDSTPEDFRRFAVGTGATYALMSHNQYNTYIEAAKETKIGMIVIGKYSDYISGVSRLEYIVNPLSIYDKPSCHQNGIRLCFWDSLMSDTGRKDITGASEDVRVCADNSHTALFFTAISFNEDIIATELSSGAVNLAADKEMFLHKHSHDVLKRQSRVLCLNEYCYVYGFTVGVHDVLLSGQTVLLFTWFDCDNIAYAIKKYKPDALVAYAGTLAKFNGMIDYRSALRCVSFIICGGGLLTSSQKAGIQNIFDMMRKKCEIHTMNGYDETFSCIYAPPDFATDRTFGIPLPGVLMKVVNKDTLFDEPNATEGEIAVRSDCKCNGYRMKDGSVRSVYDKLTDGRSWFLTGEIGKESEDGKFYYLGTYRRVFKINNKSVYPVRIDKVVGMCEGVVEVCSVVIDSITGPVVVSAVVPEESYFYNNTRMERLETAINEECSLILEEEQRPTDIVFLASIPKHADGAVDYRRLVVRVHEIRDMFANDLPVDEQL